MNGENCRNPWHGREGEKKSVKKSTPESHARLAPSLSGRGSLDIIAACLPTAGEIRPPAGFCPR